VKEGARLPSLLQGKKGKGGGLLSEEEKKRGEGFKRALEEG